MLHFKELEMGVYYAVQRGRKGYKKEKCTVRRCKRTLLRKFSVLIGGSALSPMLSSFPSFWLICIGLSLSVAIFHSETIHLILFTSHARNHLQLLLIQAHIGHFCLFLPFSCSVLYLWLLFMSLKHIDQHVFVLHYIWHCWNSFAVAQQNNTTLWFCRDWKIMQQMVLPAYH